MDDFCERLQEAHDLVSVAAGCWAIWSALDAANAYAPLRAAMEDYPRFFAASQHAFFAVTLTTLHQLYDDSSQGKAYGFTLDRLRREAHKLAQEGARGPVPLLRRELKRCRAIAAKVREVRHKLLAHRDSRFTWDGVLAQQKLSAAEVSELIGTTNVIMRTLRMWFDGVQIDLPTTR